MKIKPQLEKMAQGYRIVGTQTIIRKRAGSQKWQISIYIASEMKHKIYSSGTEDLDNAVNIALTDTMNIANNISLGLPVFPKKTDIVIEEWIEYLQRQVELQYLSIHMFRVYQTNSNRLSRTFNDVDITTIDSNKVENLLEILIADKLSKSTISSISLTFKKLMDYAVEKGYYKRTPPVLKVPKLALESEARVNFSTEEIPILLRNIDEWADYNNNKDHDLWIMKERLRFYIRFMLAFGARTNDIIYLKWKDFTITTNKSWLSKTDDAAYRNVFGHDEWEEYGLLVARLIGKKKNRNSVASGDIIKYYEYYRTEICDLPEPDDLVFPKINTEHQYNGLFKKFLIHYKMQTNKQGEIRTLYSLRHTYITEMIKKKVEVYIIAKNVGTSVKQIEDHYGHIDHLDLADQLYK